jgi:hypothetical protein
MHARMAGVQGDVMPSGAELKRQMEASGWQVAEAIDEPEEFFLRARRG